jgi:hypothetical protein
MPCKSTPFYHPSSKKREQDEQIFRETQRMVKNLQNKTQEHGVSIDVAKDSKKLLADQLERTSLIFKFIKCRKQLQITQFIAAGERRVSGIRALLVIRCKGLSEEQQSFAVDECRSKIMHFQAFPP